MQTSCTHIRTGRVESLHKINISYRTIWIAKFSYFKFMKRTKFVKHFNLLMIIKWPNWNLYVYKCERENYTPVQKNLKIRQENIQNGRNINSPSIRLRNCKMSKFAIFAHTHKSNEECAHLNGTHKKHRQRREMRLFLYWLHI